MSTTVNINMALAKKTITDVEAYMAKNGGSYSAWYAGIATNPKDRLFKGHNVSQQGPWIHSVDLGNDATARFVEDYFLRKGCKGDSGGGDSSTRYFYAYKITSSTRE